MLTARREAKGSRRWHGLMSRSPQSLTQFQRWMSLPFDCSTCSENTEMEILNRNRIARFCGVLFR